VWDRAFPVTDASGKVVSINGIAADITERKQLEEQLRQCAEDSRPSASWPAACAHDFNNLLTVIQCNANLLLDATEPAPAGETSASVARQILEPPPNGPADLTRQLLLFGAEAGAAAAADLDLREIVAEPGPHAPPAGG
jgi:hypothetical protein